MFRSTGYRWIAALGMLACLAVCSPAPGKAPPAPEMPAGWNVVSDFDAPAEQTKTIGRNLGVNLTSLRNTVYEVRGKRVQVNVLIVADAEAADRLMAKLRTMKGEEALLRKALVVYEFVGPNDVLPMIAEGREHLDSQ
jgi:hypothetical protein